MGNILYFPVYHVEKPLEFVHPDFSHAGGVDAVAVVRDMVGVEGSEDVAHMAAGVDLHAAQRYWRTLKINVTCIKLASHLPPHRQTRKLSSRFSPPHPNIPCRASQPSCRSW